MMKRDDDWTPTCSLCGLRFGSEIAAHIHEQRCEHGGVRICCLDLDLEDMDEHVLSHEVKA